MNARKPFLLVALLAFVLALALAPAAMAKSDPVPASGSWAWTNDGWGEREHPSGSFHLYGYETGQWTGTFTASDTYEPYVALVTKSGELAGKLWIHFADASVDMGGGVVLQGDMTMLVMFKAGTADATWMIHNGSGGLQHLGGQGTLAWAEAGMDYSGVVWTQK